MGENLSKGKQLRAYALAERVMKIYPGQIDYGKALAAAREYCRNVSFFNYIFGVKENYKEGLMIWVL